jgi:uncharacterized protein YneF (UPF0154 family)
MVKKKNKKALLLVLLIPLGLLLLVALGFLISKVIVPSQPEPENEITPGKISLASLTLQSDRTELRVNETTLIDVYLDTTGFEVIGVDVQLSYDPSLIKIEEIIKGDVFDSFPTNANRIDNGKVFMSALADIGQVKTGVIKVGSLRVQALSAGQATIDFIYTPQSTTDSNVVSKNNSNDALGRVSGITLNIL